MARRYAREPVIDRSLRHSVRDGVAYSVMVGSGESYFNAFAVQLKATSSQIAMLAALPALVGSLAQLVSAWLGRRIGSRRRVIVFGAALQAVMWIPIILLPPLFPDQAITVFLTCATVYYAAANLVTPQWSSLMGDLVPERKRGRYFALRNRLSSATTFIALVGAGLALHYFERSGAAYLGFVTVFAAAAVGRAVSVWHLARMVDPPGKTAAIETRPPAGLWQRMREASCIRFSLFFAAMQFAVSIAGPFFTLYMLRDLGYSYLAFMGNAAASVLMQVLALNTWGRISDSYGNRIVLVITGGLIPLLPVFWLFSTNYWWLLGAQAIGGLAWAGFSLSAGNYLYDLVPAPKRLTVLAYHNVLANTAIFAGALLGGWLGAVLPKGFTLGGTDIEVGSALLYVFALSAILRLLVAASLLPRLTEVRQPKSRKRHRLVFRIGRLNPLAAFEVVLRRRIRPAPEPKKVRHTGRPATAV
jgi:MFS family permease